MNHTKLIIDETHSTNNFLQKLVKEKQLPAFFSVRAKYQTAGRGQRGNSWESLPEENLLCSILLYPHCISANRSFYISQIVSLSLIKILNEFSPYFTIKWPNDIYWKDKKIAGILIENQLLNNKVNQSIVGIGLNINQEIFSSNLTNPTSLYKITGTKHNLDSLWCTLIDNIKHYYKLLDEGKAGQIKIAYHNHLYRREGYHLYKDDKGEFEASVLKIQPDGQLILLDKTGKKRGYYFKEVSYIIQ